MMITEFESVDINEVLVQLFTAASDLSEEDLQILRIIWN
jgi:hypothetical protein